MPLEHFLGLDHVVVTVRNLDAAAEPWRGLGFTVGTSDCGRWWSVLDHSHSRPEHHRLPGQAA
jgi:catechol 2,3-dioxygenase-like lactoylglutathione lyase family enzyme